MSSYKCMCQTVLCADEAYCRDSTHKFIFDSLLEQDATQSDVFAEVSQLVESVLDGYRVCVFAYGQTGSGKTYTMEVRLDTSLKAS